MPTQPTFTTDWLELKTARMLAVARRSQFRDAILADAKEIASEGFVWDVALAKSLRYWEGNPITGEVAGV